MWQAAGPSGVQEHDLAIEWMGAVYERVVRQGALAPAAPRAYAYTSTA
jgi:hypothetical protein